MNEPDVNLQKRNKKETQREVSLLLPFWFFSSSHDTDYTK